MGVPFAWLNDMLGGSLHLWRLFPYLLAAWAVCASLGFIAQKLDNGVQEIINHLENHPQQ